MNLIDADLANKFIDFFGDKIAVIRNALDDVFDSILDFDDNVSFSDQFTLSSFRSVTSSDISKLIGRSTIKSCPLDPVPASVLKQCGISVLLPVVTRIINQSICSGVVPESFKLALLNPLLKKPHLDSEVFANFRPISNLTFLSKLTESVVASQLIERVTNNCLDEIMQSAYKEFHSTETALVKVFNDRAIDIDRNRAVILLLLDLSAAFDTVDHSILLISSSFWFTWFSFGFGFRSYLSDRSHFVCIRGVRSAHDQYAFFNVRCASGICSGTNTVLTLCLATRGYCEAMHATWVFIFMLMIPSCISLSIP